MAVMGKKSTIALAVVAAMSSQMAWAVSAGPVEPTVIDITGKPHFGAEVEGHYFNGDLKLVGNLHASTPESAPALLMGSELEPELIVDGVNLDSINVAGHFINNANMTLKGDGAEAIEIDTMDLPSDALPGTAPRRNLIGGDIVNNGHLTVEGKGASGINISDTDTGAPIATPLLAPTNPDYALGSVINNGKIIVKNTSSPSDPDFGEYAMDPHAGISIENSHIRGDILNTGKIISEGAGTHGIVISEGNGTQSQVDGDIVNEGVISVDGEHSIAIGMKNTTFSHDILNNGKIIANGQGSVGVLLTGTQLHALDNIGGSIIAENGTAVDLSTSIGSAMVVNENGLIKGGDAAIKGNGTTNLKLINSKLFGNVSGIANVETTGNVLIDSSLFEAGQLNVNSGQLVIAQVMNLGGNMQVASGATAVVKVSDAVDAAQPLLNISGKLTLADGSKIGVTADRSSFKKETTNYILIRATEIEKLGTSAVVSVTPFLKVSNVKIGAAEETAGETPDFLNSGAADITADIGLATGDEMVDQLKGHGASQNNLRVGREFANGVLARISEDSALYRAFTSADNQQAIRLLKDLQPENGRAAQSASLSATGLANRAMGGRMGANSGDVLADTGVWVKALHGSSDQSERGGVEGYNATSRGLIIGADGKLNEQTTLGVALSHVRTDVSSDSHDKTDVTSNLLSVYGAWEQGAYDVQGSLSYGQSRNEAKRFVVGEKIKGNYDSSVLSADLSAGYTYKVNPSFSLTPTVASRYNRVQIDSYNEKGSAAALRMNSQSLENFELGGGLKAAGMWGNFKPNARVMAFYDFAQDKANSSSAFLMGGNTFVTTGAPATKWTYEAGVGLDWVHGNYTIGASYDYSRKADFNADTTYLNLRYDF